MRRDRTREHGWLEVVTTSTSLISLDLGGQRPGMNMGYGSIAVKEYILCSVVREGNVCRALERIVLLYYSPGKYGGEIDRSMPSWFLQHTGARS